MTLALRWGGVQWNPSNLPLPRIRLWPCDEQTLVFVGIADGNCDPVFGIDLYVTGRLGERLSGWLWERNLPERQHRHLIGRHTHPSWHDHCDPTKRGYKPCDKPHWHFWWTHSHPQPSRSSVPVDDTPGDRS